VWLALSLGMRPPLFSCGTSVAALAAACIVLGAVPTAFPDTTPAHDDRAVSAGKWQVTKAVVNGRQVDQEFTKMLSVSYGTDGSWVVFFKTIPAAEGTSTLDQTTEPKSFAMSTLGSGGKNDTSRKYVGIYEMHEDTRRICLVSADKPPPTEFRSTADGGEILVTMSRVASREGVATRR